jgi:hypothetical protein
MLARRQLASALRAVGAIVKESMDVITGEADDKGRLKAASGEQAPHVSIDSGLHDRVWPLHQKASAAGTAAQVRGCWWRTAVASIHDVLLWVCRHCGTACAAS